MRSSTKGRVVTKLRFSPLCLPEHCTCRSPKNLATGWLGSTHRPMRSSTKGRVVTKLHFSPLCLPVSLPASLLPPLGILSRRPRMAYVRVKIIQRRQTLREHKQIQQERRERRRDTVMSCLTSLETPPEETTEKVCNTSFNRDGVTTNFVLGAFHGPRAVSR